MKATTTSSSSTGNHLRPAGLALCISLVLSCAHQKGEQLVGDPPVLNGVVHVVSGGETLTGIAQAYGVTPQRLERINNIHDPNRLRIGQRLFIPGATERKTAVMVRAAAPREEGVFHEVKRGETLWRIANAYGVDQRTIERHNRIHDARKLEVGERLFIPGADGPKSVEMSVAEKVYHNTSGARQERIDRGKRIEEIVKRHLAEKGELPQEEEEAATPRSRQLEEPKTPAPTPTPPPEIAIGDVKPPAQVRTVGTIALSWPLPEQFSVAKKFGIGSGLNRNGVVLTAPAGTPVMAAADGEVMLVGNENDEFGGTFGNYVILYHGKREGKGLRTIYAHNSEVLVEAGEKVRRGQPIARVGRTGRSVNVKGDHLHFEIREEANPVNPVKLLPPLK